MDIGSIGTGLSYQDARLSMMQAQAQNTGSLIAQLPSTSMWSGLGSTVDIYAAVNGQYMGLLSGGREAVEIANIQLGIDMAQPKETPATKPSDAETPSAPAKKENPDVLGEILKEDGFTYTPNPYEYRKDFFADQGSAVDTKA